jgi:hypothetical protein
LKADESSEDGIEPDFKVEDEYDVNFGDLDEEISRLIKPELSSKASLGLYSTPPAPTPRVTFPLHCRNESQKLISFVKR